MAVALLAAVTGVSTHAPGAGGGDSQELVLAPASGPPGRAEILASLQALAQSRAGAPADTLSVVAASPGGPPAAAVGEVAAAKASEPAGSAAAATNDDDDDDDDGGALGGGTPDSEPPDEVPAPTRSRTTAPPTTEADPEPVIAAVPDPPVPATLTRLPSIELEVLTLTNMDRGNNGATAVYRDGCMDAEASAWARWMAEATSMVHSDGAGSAVQGCRGSNAFWGDNIGHWQPCIAAEMEAWWMASPSHRPHILDTNYTAVGIGVWQEPSGRCWFQVYFGS